MGQLYRTQILLERSQHEGLQELAAAQGRSVSQLVREAVAEYLVERDKERERRDWQEALEELTKLREEIQGRFGVYQGDLVEEIREERAEELERVMRGEP